MSWHFDMSAAPRGKIRLQPTVQGKSTRKVPERAEIVVAGACGTVTRSHWIDGERRWLMFTTEAPPIAWMPLPAPVEVTGKDGAPRTVVVLPKHPTRPTSWFQDLLQARAA